MKQKREDWELCLAGLDLNKLVFFDESGVNTLMARHRGRCPKGKRLVDSAPAGRYAMLTLMSAVRLEGVVAPMLLDGPVNAETFAGYVEECLVPALEADDILIMDNLPAHKSARITQAVEDAGCKLVYLPPYSPDLNPIENMWSKVKASLRETAARTFDALVDGVKNAAACHQPRRPRGILRTLWLRRYINVRSALSGANMADLITIDGSIGEGGGQILRTARSVDGHGSAIPYRENPRGAG